jgi:hypothetical protein
MDNTDNIIQEQFNSLPLAVRESVSRVPWKSKLQEISKGENLSAEQSRALETETLLILYGFIPSDDYAANIQQELGLDDETVGRIYKSVYNGIVSEIQKQYEIIEATSRKPLTPQPSAPQKPKEVPVQPAPKTEQRGVATPPANLPIAETGEKVHETTPEEKEWLEMGERPWKDRNNSVPNQAQAPRPQTPSDIQTPPQQTQPATPVNRIMEAAKPSYPSGKDPYREPL